MNINKLNHHQYLLNKNRFDKINKFKKKKMYLIFIKKKINNITHNNTSINNNIKFNALQKTNLMKKEPDSILKNNIFTDENKNYNKKIASNIKFKLPPIAEKKKQLNIIL